MQLQMQQAIDDADVVALVIDAREGVTPLDRVFVELLRRKDKPVVLLANKAEGRAGDAGASEAFSLGLGEPIADLGRARRRPVGSLRRARALRGGAGRGRAGRRGRASAGHRGHRPAERGQVDAGQRADRRRADADRPGSWHHPRLDPRRLDLGGPALSPGRHRRHPPQGAGARAAGAALGAGRAARHPAGRGGAAGHGRDPPVRGPGPAAGRPGRARGPRAGLRARQVGPGRGSGRSG